MRRLLQIYHRIKTLKIQGAHNVAVAGVRALRYARDATDVRTLLSARPTEPCLRNAVWCARHKSEREALDHLRSSRSTLAAHAKKLFSRKTVVYTHCHSSSVLSIISLYKSKVKRVVHTETRPLFQGRLVAKDLCKLQIPHTMYVDSAMRAAISQADVVLLGCDAISYAKIYNKIGSELVCSVAAEFGVPVYICTDSWKFDTLSKNRTTPVEQRPSSEVWARPCKGTTIANPAFDAVDAKQIAGIISELGVYTHKQFIREVLKAYPWMK